MSVEEIELAIVKASDTYYMTGTPDITDDQFNFLWAELRRLKPDSIVIKTVGSGSIPKDRRVNHIGPTVGSLDKCNVFDEIPIRFKQIKSIVSPKYDGSSVVLYYMNGVLKNALTRGKQDTSEPYGLDCTNKMVKLVPTMIPYTKGLISIRGEVICGVEHRETLRARGIPSLRNFANGVINRLEPTPDLDLLKFMPYMIRMAPFHMLTKIEMLDLIQQFMGTVTEYMEVGPGALDHTGLAAYYEQCKTKYPVDGVVITLDESVNMVSDMSFEEDSYAYKFEGESAEAIVSHVEWNPSFTGKLAPTVILKTPVFLSEATIGQVTGFNFRYIQKNGIGPNALISIIRAGEVIPDIKSVIIKAELDVPSVCPMCKSELIQEDVELRCINQDCPAKTVTRVMHFINTLAQTDKLGTSHIQQFINVTSLISIPKLLEKIKTEDPDKIADDYQITSQACAGTMKTMGMSSVGPHVTKLLKQMMVTLRMKIEYGLPTDIFLLSLCIPSISDSNSSRFAQYDLNIDDMDLITQVDTDDALASNVKSAFKDFLPLMRDVLKHVTVTPQKVIQIHSRPAVKCFIAVTGDLSVKRKVFIAEMEAQGIMIDDIKKVTKYLVNNDATSPSKKNKLAQAMGITVVNEADFRKLISEGKV
jgi:NAD-dependent DNA ligase